MQMHPFAVRDQGSVPNKQPAAKERIARFMKRFPLVFKLLWTAYRWKQSRFTAGVVGVVLNDAGSILLVEHVYHPKYPWGLPGGWLSHQDTPVSGLKRELQEEVGITVKALRPLLVGKGLHKHHLDMAFVCQANNDVQALSTELLNYRWFDDTGDALPPMMPFHQAAIETYLKQRNDEDSLC